MGLRTVFGGHAGLSAKGRLTDMTSSPLPHADISIIARHTAAQEDRSFAKRDDDDGRKHETAEGAGKGTATGGVLGAGAGMLAGLGLLAIPRLGPVVAAGGWPRPRWARQ